MNKIPDMFLRSGDNKKKKQRKKKEIKKQEKKYINKQMIKRNLALNSLPPTKEWIGFTLK